MWWGDETRGGVRAWGNNEAAQHAEDEADGTGGADDSVAAIEDELSRVRSAAEEVAWEAKEDEQGGGRGSAEI